MEKRKGEYGKGKRRGNKKKSERGKGKRKRSDAWRKGDFSELPKHPPAGSPLCRDELFSTGDTCPIPPALVPPQASLQAFGCPRPPGMPPAPPVPQGALSRRIAAGPWQPVGLPSPSQPPGIAQA